MRTIVIDPEPNYFHTMEKAIRYNCPQVNIEGYASCCEEAGKMIDKIKPALVFMEINMPQTNTIQFLEKFDHLNFETIFIAQNTRRAIDAIKCQASGYLVKPFQLEDLIDAVKVAENRMSKKAQNRPLPKEPFVQKAVLFPEELIGIPTMEGLDFIPAKEIIRCEGFQRCTRIVTSHRSDILSSYPIGFFRKRLEPHLFYLTHKSHLINLFHIRKYLKEGTIKMTDGTAIPISKRRKSEFIKLLTGN